MLKFNANIMATNVSTPVKVAPGGCCCCCCTCCFSTNVGTGSSSAGASTPAIAK